MNRLTLPHCRNDRLNVGLVVDGERYVVLCDAANRGEAYRTLAKWAENPELSLSWEDAARLSAQIAREANR